MAPPNKAGVRLPPGCGADLGENLIFNPYQAHFQAARRQRYCLNCKTIGSMDENSRFTCKRCHKKHANNLTAPRLYDRFLLLAGRGSGKTLIGAHAAREELLVPNSIGWVMGATYKILHDSTFPTLVRRLPPQWIKRWDPEHMEITLLNGAMVAFRSLEDPERARGPHGVSWGWLDEAAQSPERAYDVFEPTLIKAGGILFCTTTPLGYDWTYDKLEKRATVYKEPGYYFKSFWSEENPLFKTNPTMMKAIDRARKNNSPEFFAQEYRAERRNATGLVYSYQKIDDSILRDDAAIKKLIPEWPDIDAARPRIIGLDSGADHPFGALLIVAVESGLVVVAEYLKRMQAISMQLPAICTQLGVTPGLHTSLKWAANKNEANLRLEFGLKGVGVIPVESKHEVGIQRVNSWLHSGQLYFAYTCPKTIEQMKAYRYANNLTVDQQKKREQVFKQNDELPDALRYALMAWPELPKAVEPLVGRDMRHLDAQTRGEIERMAQWHNKDTKRDLEPLDEGYPTGDFYTNEEGSYDIDGFYA